MKNFKRLSALLLALVLVLSFAACGGNKDKDETTNDPGVSRGDTQVNTPAADDETSVSDDATEGSTIEDGTAPNENAEPGKVPSGNGGSTQSGGKNPQQVAVNTKKGLNSNDVNTIVAYYKQAAKDTATIDGKQSMSLARIDFTPKSNLEKFLLSSFKSVATAALKANSTERTDIPGNYKALVPSDLNSANAVVDGNKTVITLNVKTQIDDQNTKYWGNGPVGHTVGTLGDITQALDAIPVVKVDYSRGRIELKYTNCKVVVTVDNSTGKIVKGEWGYTVNIWLTDIYASGFGNEGKITNIGGAVDFKVNAPKK